MKKIIGKNERLLKEFLVVEALDFKRYRKGKELNAEGLEYVSKVMEKIKKGIIKENKGFNRLVIESLGNSGAIIRKLEVDGRGKWFNWDNGNLNIVLCSCGNIKCWGSISFEDEK